MTATSGGRKDETAELTLGRELGIVVIGRNEGSRLVRCLESLRIDPQRIVYVDSGSTDNSLEQATVRGIAVLKLSLELPFTAARARNEGFALLLRRRPAIQFVQFLDGDCELVSGWLAAAVKFLNDQPQVAAVCGRRRERNPDASVYNRLCDLEWDTPIGMTSACGGDSVIRVWSFKAVSGFREQLMAGEEPELCSRLRAAGWEIWRLPNEMTIHDAAMTNLRQWWRRMVRSGFGYAELVGLTHDSLTPLYIREVARSLFWAAAVPIVVFLLCILSPFGSLALVLYPIQITRTAIAKRHLNSFCWMYAIYMLVAKFAEAYGIFSFAWSQLRGRKTALIEYKDVSR